MSPEDAVDKLGRLIKKKWVNWKSLEFSLRSLYAFGILLFIVAFIFLVISINEAASLRFEFSTHGVSILTQIFDAPIKSFGALLGIVTLYAALKRMKANDRQVEIANTQIKIASEQNRLSNYFKFRQEFVVHLTKQEINEILESVEGKDFAENTFYNLYPIFYGNYRNFDSDMISNTRNLLLEYYHGLSSLFLNQKESIKSIQNYEIALSGFSEFIENNNFINIMDVHLGDVIDRYTEVLELKSKTIKLFENETKNLIKFHICNRLMNSIIDFNGFSHTENIRQLNANVFRALNKVYKTSFWALKEEVGKTKSKF